MKTLARKPIFRNFEELVNQGIKIHQIHDKEIQRHLRQIKYETGELNKEQTHREDDYYNYKCNTCGSVNMLHPEHSECFICGTNNFSITKPIDLIK